MEWGHINKIKSYIPSGAPVQLKKLPYSHDELQDALPDIAEAIKDTLSEEGVSFNQPPAFSPTSLSEKKTVYYSVVGGRYLIMSPSWEHIRCLTVTDPDGDDLSIRLGSSPQHGMANVFPSRTGPGSYNVTIGYQISNEVLREIHESRDDLTDSFTVVAAKSVHRS